LPADNSTSGRARPPGNSPRFSASAASTRTGRPGDFRWQISVCRVQVQERASDS
jgi:hypothetical protein